ncbi:hypothetical protein [Phyllobacterium sp. A18/5-2]|uniref:hypothetical protein n=1 Tax=Phyllobacterium sp. A18/5-2 TaxID=2978392 RepID=UPI0021C7943B|nr:hypothetical protein [Phyllobacterium sp. A18/5-2]
MEKHGSQTPVRETATETRQGPLGRPVLMVLIGGLILAAIAWGAAEMFGESSDNSATIGQESPAAGQNKPSDQATPPSGDQPTTNAPAVSPTPQSGTGGDTQAKPPSNTSQ